MDNRNRKQVSQADIQAVLQTPEGQQLIRTLQSAGRKPFEEIISLIKMGSYEKAIEQMKPMMESENTKQLIRQINQKIG